MPNHRILLEGFSNFFCFLGNIFLLVLLSQILLTEGQMMCEYVINQTAHCCYNFWQPPIHQNSLQSPRHSRAWKKWGWCSFNDVFSSYFDCEVRSQGAGDSQDLLIRELLEVQSGVLQLVLTWQVQQQLTSDPLESFTLHVCRGKSRQLQHHRQNHQLNQKSKRRCRR